VTSVEVEIADIIIDCSDPERVATFWADLLDRRVKGRKGPYVWLDRPEGGVGVGFQKVAEAKMSKNRVHIDVAVPDVLASKTKVESLGGQRVHGYETGGFLVMADPEGNEFCLIPVAPLVFDEEGRTDYLDGLAIEP
jgi:predicted enzyme related to lactoylglutathione lyase